ncbi:MAG TPA: N-acetyl-D-Glu racemase DgcA [Solimonas sp.]
MKRTLQAQYRTWPLKEPFVISRGRRSEARVVVVEIAAGGHRGRGESAGVTYKGETQEQLMAQIESVRDAIEGGVEREDLLALLPAGGARAALDAALWDLQARQSGIPVWQRAGVGRGAAIDTAVTIGMRSPEACGRAAAALAAYPWIKLKVGRDDPVAAIAAVRQAAPRSRLIVDANQAWEQADLLRWLPDLERLQVDLLEQPLARGRDGGLSRAECPIPICADESVDGVEDLPRLHQGYRYINIKLDKCGGLTAALQLARTAQGAGFRLMSGCMVASSLSMAPAMVLSQLCEINDLDGPLLLAEDWLEGIVYDRGCMSPPWGRFWG